MASLTLPGNYLARLLMYNRYAPYPDTGVASQGAPATTAVAPYTGVAGQGAPAPTVEARYKLIQSRFTFVIDLLSTGAITATSANGFCTEPHGKWRPVVDHARNLTGLELSWHCRGDPTKLKTTLFTEIQDHGVTRETGMFKAVVQDPNFFGVLVPVPFPAPAREANRAPV